jgi:hypothetical protein
MSLPHDHFPNVFDPLETKALAAAFKLAWATMSVEPTTSTVGHAQSRLAMDLIAVANSGFDPQELANRALDRCLSTNHQRELKAILELGDRAGTGAYIPQRLLEVLLDVLGGRRPSEFENSPMFEVVALDDDRSTGTPLGSSPIEAVAQVLFEAAAANQPSLRIVLIRGTETLEDSASLAVTKAGAERIVVAPCSRTLEQE